MSAAVASRRPAAVARPAASLAGGLETTLLLGCVATLPFQIPVGPELRVAPADGFLLAAALVGVARLKYVSWAWSFWHVAMLLTFVTGSLITALASGSLSRYVLLNKDIGILLLFLTYVLITSTVTQWDGIRRVLQVFILSVALQNLAGIVAFVAGYFYGIETPLTVYGGQRLAGMMVDPNAYGGLLVLAFVLCEVSSHGPRPVLPRRQVLFCRVTLGLGILFTFSRGTWCALALAMLPVLVTRARKAVQLVLAVAAVLTAVGLFAGQRFLDLVQNMATRPQQGRGRFELAEGALAHAARDPLLGGGLGSFIEAEGAIVHNTPLWFLADFGLLGLLVFTGFIGWFALHGLRTWRMAPPREKRIVLALLLGHVAMFGVSMSIEAFYQRHWWLVLALLASGYSIEARRMAMARRRRHRLRVSPDLLSDPRWARALPPPPGPITNQPSNKKPDGQYLSDSVPAEGSAR